MSENEKIEAQFAPSYTVVERSTEGRVEITSVIIDHEVVEFEVDRFAKNALEARLRGSNE